MKITESQAWKKFGFGCMRLPLCDFKDAADMERIFAEQLEAVAEKFEKNARPLPTKK